MSDTKPAPRRGSGALKRAGQGAVYVVFRALETLLRLLPLKLVFRLGQAAGWLAWALGGSYRRLVRHNLRLAFGREKTEPDLAALARRHFRTLGGNLFTSLKLPTMPLAHIDRVVEIEGFEHVQAARAAGRGFIFAICHQGNWELLAQRPDICAGSAQGTLFQPLSNPFLNRHVMKLRGRFGFQLFDRHDGFHAPVKFLRDNGGLGVLVDQHAGDAGVWAPLFGRLASTTNLATLLSRRTGAPILPLGVATTGPARWKITIAPPLAAPPDRAVTALNAALEKLIRRSPADWFWVHNRWKTPRPDFLLARVKRGLEGPPDAATQPFEILLRAPNWLGDACMALPAVRAFKLGRPDARVTVLTPAKLADFWRAVPEVDAIIGKDGGESVLSVRKRIRATGTRFDVAVLLVESPRAALEVSGCGIPRVVGYHGRWRKRLLNQIIPPARPGPLRHHVHHFLRVAEICGADVTTPALFAPLPVRPAKMKTKPGPARPPLRLGLCAGAEYGPAKRWPLERFAATARAVREATGAQWTLVGAPAETALGATLAGLIGPCRNLVGKTTLAELCAELAALDLLLTNDTGTMHLAAALGVPVVAVFGSTEPAWTGPLGDRHTVLRRHVPCSPCFRRECPRPHEPYRCFVEISPEDATRAVLTAVEKYRKTPPAEPALAAATSASAPSRKRRRKR